MAPEILAFIGVPKVPGMEDPVTSTSNVGHEVGPPLTIYIRSYLLFYGLES